MRHIISIAYSESISHHSKISQPQYNHPTQYYQPTMQQPVPPPIQIHRPALTPKFQNIGYANPRYNSMLITQDDKVLVPCGASLRKLDLVTHEVLWARQIGCSQIFQILENACFVLVINFQGLVTLLEKKGLSVAKQFYLTGKEIRHSCITDNYIAVSCQLNNRTQHCHLELYSIPQIVSTPGTSINIKPIYQQSGYFYYPEIYNQQYLIFIQFDDPNPKGRSRTETVMNKKLPIRHRILEKKIGQEGSAKEISSINFEGEILCTAQNISTQQIFYLHQSRRITILNLQAKTTNQIQITSASPPQCIQPYKLGIIFASKTNTLTYLHRTPSSSGSCSTSSTTSTSLTSPCSPSLVQIKLETSGLSTCYSIKKSPQSQTFYFFNENGLELYRVDDHCKWGRALFDITNCGVSFNSNGDAFCVADFGGNVYVFNIGGGTELPDPVARVCVGMPVRSLVWCWKTNAIIIGCVGGCLYSWIPPSPSPTEITTLTLPHTINIIRYFPTNYIILGTSDGCVHILDETNLKQLYVFQSHFPIHYENEKDRELFGSMKNYAEIWSITVYPDYGHGQGQGKGKGKEEGNGKGKRGNGFFLGTCSQDQSEKVYRIQIGENNSFTHTLIHHLKGHSLAVTSIDCKPMHPPYITLYASCSDDKLIRIRDPTNNFQLIHQLQTSTIKQWHTLTYLSLQPNGHRIAIGSQNGYLFIFDLHTKKLLFAEKIHMGGIEGMDWKNGKLVTCSSDLCISIAHL